MSQDRRQAGLGLRPSLYLSQKNKPRARPSQHEAQGHAQQAENRNGICAQGHAQNAAQGYAQKTENRIWYMKPRAMPRVSSITVQALQNTVTPRAMPNQSTNGGSSFAENSYHSKRKAQSFCEQK